MESDKKFVLNEVLCYITNRIDILDEPTLTRILITNFPEKDIDAAKAKLCDDLAIKSTSRKGEGRASKNALDMIKIIKEIGAASDKLPLYVARDLHKLPPITFDHLDVTRILKELASLRTEVSTLILKDEINQDEISKLRSEMITIKNMSTSPRPVCPSVHRPFNRNKTRAFEGNIHSNDESPTVQVTPVTPRERQKQFEPRRDENKIDSPTHIDEWGPPAMTPPPIIRAQKEIISYRKIAMSMANDRKKEDEDNDGFKMVSYRKRKPAIRNMRGAGQSSGILQAVASTVTLYVSRAKKEITAEHIQEYIIHKGQTALKVEYIKPYQETSFNSFLVTIEANNLDTFLSEGFWPTGIVYRKYIYKRNYTATQRL